MADSYIYVTPDFAKQYQQSTGKSLSGSVFTAEDYNKMANEAGLAPWTGIDYSKSSDSTSSTPAGGSTGAAGSGTQGSGASTVTQPQAGAGSNPASLPSDFSSALDAVKQKAAGGDLQGAATQLSQQTGISMDQALKNVQQYQTTQPSQTQTSPMTNSQMGNLDDTLAKTKQMIASGDTAGAAALLSQSTGLSLDQATANVQAYQQAQQSKPAAGATGTAGSAPVTQPPAPTQPAVQQQPQAPTFAEFLASMGLQLPQVQPFSFDPGNYQQAAQAEADLIYGPQADAYQFQHDQRLAQQKLKGEAALKKLRESQAQRRLFSSPVGLFTEQEQNKANGAALSTIDDELNQRMAGLEAQRANRISAYLGNARKQAYSDWARSLTNSTQQFNALVNLYDRSVDNIRADNKQQAELAKWIADANIKAMNAESLANYREGQLDINSTRLSLDAKKAAAQLQANWAKIKASNIAKFGFKGGDLYNKAMDAAMAGDDESADALMAKAAQAYATDPDTNQNRQDARAQATALASTFRSVATKYGAQVAAMITAGIQEPDPGKQASWFALADNAIATVEGDKQAAILGRQKALADYNASLSREKETASTRRSYTLKFGPDAADSLLQAEQYSDAGMPDEAAAARQQAAAQAKAFMDSGKSQGSTAWKGMMGEIQGLEDRYFSQAKAKADPYNRDLPAMTHDQLTASTQAIVAKWAPQLSTQDQAALKAYLKARGLMQ